MNDTDVLDGIDLYNDLMPEQAPPRHGEDNKLHVTFYRKAVPNLFKSEQENRPVFDEADYIKIIIPGDKNSEIDAPVDSQYRLRFADKYRAYLAGTENKRTGTPLTAWPMVTIAQRAELASLHITMVEDIVNCSDAMGQKIMGYHDLKRKAIAFLEASKEVAQEKKLEALVDAAVAKAK